VAIFACWGKILSKFKSLAVNAFFIFNRSCAVTGTAIDRLKLFLLRGMEEVLGIDVLMTVGTLDTRVNGMSQLLIIHIPGMHLAIMHRGKLRISVTHQTVLTPL
jgi:hypothetical protein